MKIRIPIDPPPHRVCDVDVENYAQILWPKPHESWQTRQMWSPEPNPCPVGEVGAVITHHGKPYTITAIDVTGGPQIAAPALLWEWVVSLADNKEREPDERESTITPDEVDEILERAFERLPELSKQLDTVFQVPDRLIRLD